MPELAASAPHPAHGGVPLRASDADRSQAAVTLQQAAGLGMLTLAEVEDRLGAACAAQLRSELAALTADLPVPRPGAAPGPPHGPAERAEHALRHATASAQAALTGVIALLRHRVLAIGLCVVLLMVAMVTGGLMADGSLGDVAGGD